MWKEAVGSCNGEAQMLHSVLFRSFLGFRRSQLPEPENNVGYVPSTENECDASIVRVEVSRVRRNVRIDVVGSHGKTIGDRTSA